MTSPEMKGALFREIRNNFLVKKNLEIPSGGRS
jgi:hypothetical protein